MNDKKPREWSVRHRVAETEIEAAPKGTFWFSDPAIVYPKQLDPWSYVASDKLEDDVSSFEKTEFEDSVRVDYVWNLMICAEILKEKGWLRPETEFGYHDNSAIPHKFLLFDWSEKPSLVQADLYSIPDDEMRRLSESDRGRLFYFLREQIRIAIDGQGPLSEDWYLLSILALYYSEPNPSPALMFSVGALHAEYLAMFNHSEQLRTTQMHQAIRSRQGGQGMKEKREANMLALFQAAEKEAEVGVYDQYSEKEFRKAAVRRVTRIYEGESKKFPTSSKTHSSYFEEITEHPEFKSKYYSLWEKAQVYPQNKEKA